MGLNLRDVVCADLFSKNTKLANSMGVCVGFILKKVQVQRARSSGCEIQESTTSTINILPSNGGKFTSFLDVGHTYPKLQTFWGGRRPGRQAFLLYRQFTSLR
jgi:hypothetical protein